MNDLTISVDTNFIRKLEKSFPEVPFKRLERNDGMYITNEISKSLMNDLRIFLETQVKRLLRASSLVDERLKKKLAYFSQQEDELGGEIYKCDNPQDLNGEKYTVHYVGHASLLIQIPDFNILTDPVFGNLSLTFYPEKTLSYPSLEKLPRVNVILISHNHRDHLDQETMLIILQHYRSNCWSLPLVLVPLGDKLILKSLGFENVEEVDWFSKIIVSNPVSEVHFISIPSDHRSGRGVTDHHKSLVTGWVINPEQANVLFKLSGDTRPLTDENQKAIDAVLWNETKAKMKTYDVFTDLIFVEPNGPNYTRKDMDVTHQSTSYSVLLKFTQAANLSLFSKMRLEVILPKIQTLMIHHNKFELGPDRFNEGLFIFKKLCLYLNLTKEELNNEYVREKQKKDERYDLNVLKKSVPFVLRPLLLLLGTETAMTVHPKDFVIQDLLQTSQILEELNISNSFKFIKDFIVSNTIFPKIGERLNSIQLRESACDVTIIKKYNKRMHIVL